MTAPSSSGMPKRDVRPDDDAAVCEGKAAEAIKSARRITSRSIINHLPDLVIALALLLACAGIVRKGFYARPLGSVDIVRVAAPQGIPPFRVIRKEDVQVGRATVPAAPVSIGDVTGRYAIEYLARNQTVDLSKLSSASIPATDLQGLTLLQVAFDSNANLLNLRPPMRITLVASSPPQTTPQGIVVEDVYLLQVRPQADRMTAVVGMTAENLAKLAPFLGRGSFVPALPAD